MPHMFIGSDMAKSPKIEVTESEEQLIDRAQSAVSQSNWVVGECASKWTQKYARGRTDADFGRQVGLSGDQVFQRRRVWETFSDVFNEYGELKWSHFYVALNWDDAPECLQWADEQTATVSEMKAWRRAQRGEDLTEDLSSEPPLDEWAAANVLSISSDAASEVKPAGDPSATVPFTPGQSSEREAADTVPAFAREAGGEFSEDYVPFRNTAGGKAPEGEQADVAVLERPRPTAEALVKRWTSSVARINRMLDEQLVKDVKKLPEKLRVRFVEEVRELAEKVSSAQL